MDQVEELTKHFQREHEQNILIAHRVHDRLNDVESQLNDGAFKAADAGLRTSVGINGAAIVSLLAFAGVMLTKDGGNKALVANMVNSFWWFGSGVVAATSAMVGVFAAYMFGTTVFRQRAKIYEYPFFVDSVRAKSYWRIANILLYGAMVVGVGSVGLFIKGCFVVYNVLGRL
jgi:hypothetical protein